jgi:hypothetical protein
MTKTRKKNSLIATISATVLLAGILFLSNGFNLAEAGEIVPPPPPPSTNCPADGTVQHWDKVVFEITKDKSQKIPKNSLDSEHIIILNDQANEIINIEDKVKDKIRQKWGLSLRETVDVEVKIIDVKYETVNCGLQGDTGPQGQQGPQGPKGDTGPAGEQKLSVRAISHAESDISDDSKQIVLDCAADETVTGGGFGANDKMVVIYNGPDPIDSDDPTGWRVIGIRTFGSGFLEAHAMCAKLVP